MSDQDVQKHNIAFMIEHPAAYAAFEEIAQEYDGNVAMHVVTQDTVSFWQQMGENPDIFELNDVLVRGGIEGDAIAIIKSDGRVHRLDQED